MSPQESHRCLLHSKNTWSWGSHWCMSMENAEAFKVPIPWTMMLLKPYLAHFQHISALIAASVLLSCRERGLDSWKSRPRSSDDRMLGSSGSEGGGSWSTSSGREHSLSPEQQ